jgi:hypothetical protein
MRIFINVSIHVGTTALFLMSVFCREECATGIHFACVLVEHPQNACREPARVQSGQTVIPAGATGRICAARRCSAAVCRGSIREGIARGIGGISQGSDQRPSHSSTLLTANLFLTPLSEHSPHRWHMKNCPEGCKRGVASPIHSRLPVDLPVPIPARREASMDYLRALRVRAIMTAHPPKSWAHIPA